MKLSPATSFWVNSILYTLLYRFSVIFFGVISYILLAKMGFATASEMGVWSLFMSIITIIEMIKQGLLRNPMIKYLSEPEYADQKNKVQSSCLFTNILFTILMVLLILAGGKSLAGVLQSQELFPMLLWSILFIILLIPFNHFEVLLQANFKFRQIFLGYLFRQGIFLLGIVVLLLFFKPQLTLLNLVKLQILSIFLGSLALLISARKYFFKGFDLDKKLMVRMLHFGKYIFGTNVFSNISRYTDQFITAAVLKDQAQTYVAYYNVVSRINNMIDVPSVAVADVLFPKNVEAMANEGHTKVKYYFERMVGNIIAVLLPISLGIFLLPSLTIKIIAGSKYMAAIPILETVILTSFVRPFFYQFGTTMDAINKPNVNFYVNTALTILNLILLALGLQFFGFMGAAYGTVLYNIISFVVLLIVLKRYVNVELKNIFQYTFQCYREVLRFRKKLLTRKPAA